jgi:hypothetical protein
MKSQLGSGNFSNSIECVRQRHICRVHQECSILGLDGDAAQSNARTLTCGLHLREREGRREPRVCSFRILPQTG